MTNEQAIKWLKDYIQNTPFQMEQYERAFEMAIKALKRAERWDEHICFDCKYFSENEEEYDEKRCLKCTLIGTEWEQKK